MLKVTLKMCVLCKKSITETTKLLISTTVFNIDNNKKCFLSTKSPVRISEGSYYTKDWNNDAEN